MSGISTCYSGPMLCSTMAISSHMQPIFCLCDPRCLDMVSLPEIKAAFDNGCSGGGGGTLRRSSAKSNSNSGNLLHVKMFSAARLDCTPPGSDRKRESRRCVFVNIKGGVSGESGGNLGPIPILANILMSLIFTL